MIAFAPCAGRIGGADPVLGSGDPLHAPWAFADDRVRFLVLLRDLLPDRVRRSGPVFHIEENIRKMKDAELEAALAAERASSGQEDEPGTDGGC